MTMDEIRQTLRDKGVEYNHSSLRYVWVNKLSMQKLGTLCEELDPLIHLITAGIESKDPDKALDVIYDVCESLKVSTDMVHWAAIAEASDHGFFTSETDMEMIAEETSKKSVKMDPYTLQIVQKNMMRMTNNLNKVNRNA